MKRLSKLGLVTLLATLVGGCGPLPGELGATCTTDSECTGGICLLDVTGGYCSQDCTATACESGAVCVARSSGKGGAAQGGSCNAASVCLRACAADFDCRQGTACASVGGAKACVAACTTDADCGGGQTCAAGLCQGKGQVGAKCSSDSQCGDLQCETTFIDGMCTQPCVARTGAEPGSAQACPTGSQCVSVGESQGLCMASCNADADCRAGYSCDANTRSCRSKCASDAACGVGWFCDVCSGTCNEGKAKPTQLGASCEADAKCSSAYCLTSDLGWSGGVCSKTCASQTDCGAEGVCIQADPTSICLQRCSSNFDCRGEYYCQDVGDGDAVCLPRCNATNAVDLCGGDFPVCDQTSGACVQAGGSGTATVERRSLGTVDIRANTESAKFTFDLPRDAISFTVVLKGGIGGKSTLGKLIGPGNKTLFDLDAFSSSAVRVIPVNDGDFGVIYPNSPRLSVTPGTWEFTLYNEGGGGRGEVLVFIKKTENGAPPQNGKLPLNLFFCGVEVGGTKLTAATGRNNPHIVAMLDEVRSIYATVNLEVPAAGITYLDCNRDFASIETTDGKSSDFRKLLEQSSQVPAGNHALNFFLVKTISSGQPGFITLGIAGGIPGIPYEQSNNASGVAVTTADLGTANGDKSVARVMAHEGGHWLGLFHTTEQPGTQHDPLPDTVECAASKDRNRDGIVVASECAGSGAQYMMFWEANANARVISSQQQFVLLRNPAIQ